MSTPHVTPQVAPHVAKGRHLSATADRPPCADVDREAARRLDQYAKRNVRAAQVRRFWRWFYMGEPYA
jgi:hypothetical protein